MIETVLLSVAAGIGAKLVANVIKDSIASKSGQNITVKLPSGEEITLSKKSAVCRVFAQ